MSGGITYTAKNLAEVADYFDTLASDQRACIGRFVKNARGKRDCEIEAKTWAAAAEMLRTVSLGDEPPAVFQSEEAQIGAPRSVL